MCTGKCTLVRVRSMLVHVQWVCVQLYTKKKCASIRKYGQCVQTTYISIHNALVHSEVIWSPTVHVHIKSKKHQVCVHVIVHPWWSITAECPLWSYMMKHHSRVSTSSLQTVHDEEALRPCIYPVCWCMYKVCINKRIEDKFVYVYRQVYACASM